MGRSCLCSSSFLQAALHTSPCAFCRRLAALLDGVDPPENMRRCFANNYDVEVCVGGIVCACAVFGVRGSREVSGAVLNRLAVPEPFP